MTKYVRAKERPYNESIRVPIIFATLDGTTVLVMDRDDIVLDVDLRESLTTAQVSRATTRASNGSIRTMWHATRSVLEHTGTRVPTYCGARSKGSMYARPSRGRRNSSSTKPSGRSWSICSSGAMHLAIYHVLKALGQVRAQPPDGDTWLA